jgi:transposase
MAHGYRGGDRGQSFLLPPDVRDWLPGGHVAWLVIEAIEAIDTSEFHARSRRGGRGRAGFDPDVLLALLVYCYSSKVISSRRIERMCETDVACRVITGNEVPDHTVIARFRRAHQDAFEALFVRVLAVCAAEGMVQVGAITLDGTKIAANASRLANRTRKQLREELDELREQVAAIVADAAAADAAEDALFGDDARGDELVGRLAAVGDRAARLRQCLADIDGTAAPSTDERAAAAAADAARLEAEVAAAQAQRAAYEAERDAGRRGVGRPRPDGEDKPPPRPSHIARKRQALENARVRAARHAQRVAADGGRQAKRNPTDPDSRMMKSQGAWEQAYNAQAATSRDGVIVANDVTNLVTDAAVFLTMLTAIARNLTAAGIEHILRAILADAGYHSQANLAAGGPPRLIPPHNNRTDEHSGRMRQRLEQPAMKSLYKRRGRVERTFAQIKHNMGFTRFSRRGLAAAKAEWNLISTAHNLLALHRHRAATNPQPIAA